MSSALKKRTTRILATSALLVAAALDVGSTLLAFQRMGGVHGEANLLFRAFGGHESSDQIAVVLILSIKAVASGLAILWIWLGMRRIPTLYPQTDGHFGFIRFANHLMYGKDVPWWIALFGIPPFKRFVGCAGLPIIMAIVVSSVAASVTNTFGLITSYPGVFLLWVIGSTAGVLLAVFFMYWDFQNLVARSGCQQAVGEEVPPEANVQPTSDKRPRGAAAQLK